MLRIGRRMHKVMLALMYVGGAVYSRSVFSPSGALYVSSYDGHLYFITANGSRAWRILLGPLYYSPLFVHGKNMTDDQALSSPKVLVGFHVGGGGLGVVASVSTEGRLLSRDNVGVGSLQCAPQQLWATLLSCNDGGDIVALSGDGRGQMWSADIHGGSVLSNIVVFNNARPWFLQFAFKYGVNHFLTVQISSTLVYLSCCPLLHWRGPFPFPPRPSACCSIICFDAVAAGANCCWFIVYFSLRAIISYDFIVAFKCRCLPHVHPTGSLLHGPCPLPPVVHSALSRCFAVRFVVFTSIRTVDHVCSCRCCCGSGYQFHSSRFAWNPPAVLDSHQTVV